MWEQSPEEEWVQPFFVAHHDAQRSAVGSEYLNLANNCNYDMLTVTITNRSFQSRVLDQLSKYLGEAPNDDLPYPNLSPLTDQDTSLTPGDVTPHLLGFTSSWIDICSPDPLVSSLSKQVLLLEVAYAAFCGLEYVFIAGPRLYHNDAATSGVMKYARVIQNALRIGSHMQISIVVPMIDIPDMAKEYHPADLKPRDVYLDDIEDMTPTHPDLFGTWDIWNWIRTTCKYNTRLFTALVVPTHHPTTLEIQSRWYSEPIRAVALSGNAFVSNQNGNVALPPATRTFISRLMRVRVSPWILLQDVEPIPDAKDITISDDGSLQWKPNHEAIDPTPAESKATVKQPSSKYPFSQLDYIRRIQREQPPRTPVEKYGSGYQDYLQIPLQPLTDNLESMTYEVFEKDPVKYNLYEQAIGRALRDWADKNKIGSGPGGTIVLAIAGAGRGPLVTRAIRASDSEKVDIEIWAVEKNPNAFVLLQRHNKNLWNNRVNLVKSDMRSWKGPWRADVTSITPCQPPASVQAGTESPPVSVPNPGHTPVDILISELLGSFADNELSPECLDGVLHLLSPQGISIPQSYTSFLTPIAAPKLHADLLGRAIWDPNASETPAVVWLHAIDYLALDASNKSDQYAELSRLSISPFEPTTPAPSTIPKVLPAWSFYHGPLKTKMPYPISNTHNERFARLNFRAKHRGVCHGLGGYFESVLYPGIELSTNPLTMDAKSKFMISWFPIYFPLKTPLYIPDNSELTVTLWRQTDDRKVWYEWTVESWTRMSIDGGKQRIRLGASDLHSSIKNGCMM